MLKYQKYLKYKLTCLQGGLYSYERVRRAIIELEEEGDVFTALLQADLRVYELV
jgi:hypothetical protein